MIKTIVLRDIVDRFFDPTTTIVLPETNERLTPFSDLAFNTSENCFYFYRNGVWLLLPDTNARTGDTARMIELFLREYFPTVNTTTTKLIEIKEALLRESPSRFSTANKVPNYIVFSDLTLDLSTLPFTPTQHARTHFALLSIPFPLSSANSPTPTFNAYLNHAFPSPEEQDFLLSVIGYYLIPYAKEPAAFYLYGPPRTGKSRFLRLLQSIFTPRFYSSFSLQSLTTDSCAVAELSGKFINILDEDESERVASDKFKALVDQNPTEARRLYQAPFTFKPYAKFLFASNQLPNFRYVDGLERRLHFIHFKNPVPVASQDKELDEKLYAELPGIIGKALAAATSFLGRNGEFKPPLSSLVLKEEFLRFAMPAAQFVAECAVTLPEADEVASGTWTPNKRLYDAYATWCHATGHRALSSQNFHRQLLALPNITTRIVHDERRKNLQLNPSSPYAYLFGFPPTQSRDFTDKFSNSPT